MGTYKVTVVIEKDEDGYYASCPDLQGCYTQGDSFEEAVANIKDAIKLHIQESLACGEEIPQPEVVGLASIEVAV